MATRRLLKPLARGAAAVAAGAACLHNGAALCEPKPPYEQARQSPTGVISKSVHPNVVLLDSKAVRALFTILRDENTTHIDFSQAADRLMTLLAEEGLAELPGVRPKLVTTPCGRYEGLELPAAHTLAVVSIVRSGDTLLEAVRRISPGVAVGKILIQRDENTLAKSPKLFYVKVPADIASRTVLLVDPMLATGQSAEVAVRELNKRGVPDENIVFLNVRA